MKRTAISRDPERIREWQDRSRKQTATNARQTDRGRAMGREGIWSTALREARAEGLTSHALVGRIGRSETKIKPTDPWALRNKKNRRQRVKFRPRRSASNERCAACAAVGVARTAVHWHHVLPQERLRVYARSLRLPEKEHDALLRRLIHDWRNIVPMCGRCHARHDHPTDRFAAADVPKSAWEFVAELGEEWVERLRGMYRVPA
jgi:hypothetical protein